MSGSRKARVAEAIRDNLSEMIAREVKDPRVTAAGVVSVTHVDVNADLSVATVYVSVYGDERAADRAIEGLRGAAGFLRGPLGRRLRLVRPPELRFMRDTGIAFGMELAKIVREDEARRVVERTGEGEEEGETTGQGHEHEHGHGDPGDGDE